MASLRLFPGLAARLQLPQAPLRSVVRQFSSSMRAGSSASATSSRLGQQQFFTSSQPKIQFLAGGFSKVASSVGQTVARSTGAGLRSGARPASSPASFTAAFFRRAFSTTRTGSARATYYGRGGGSFNPPPKPSFMENLRRRLNRIDPNRVVYYIIGINVAVFLLWQYAINSAVSLLQDGLVLMTETVR